ncbi:hypothetical protein [Streptomyces sp. Isolate_219]|uniref:hypothetical protein n=1 Tax=Streptomyces sp. Isolate_219 TaxID=2950110 RepID=UPI0021C6DBC4|nr:hypothetical protein [Streptomyces sp. Isolate_219]MCR8575007.1 hypothetical protein [Streptomyces sp. Isolate_219]
MALVAQLRAPGPCGRDAYPYLCRGPLAGWFQDLAPREITVGAMARLDVLAPQWLTTT